VPLVWANTRTALGNALFVLGAREKSRKRLEEAADAYKDAMQINDNQRNQLTLYLQNISDILKSID
jgi:hypothetical protein